MKKLELYVVQDIYNTIESAEDCTVFFPVVPGIKKEGTYINLERRLSAMRPCLARGENEISDYEAILGVGKALGMGDMLKGWETPRDCFELMKQCSKGMPCDITGVTWEGLENSKGIQWPFREGEELAEDQRRLYGDGNFFTPSKRRSSCLRSPEKIPCPSLRNIPICLTREGDPWDSGTHSPAPGRFSLSRMQLPGKHIFICIQQTPGQRESVKMIR